MFRVFAYLLAVLFSTASFAQAVHEYNDDMTNIVHLMWLAFLIIVAILCLFIHKNIGDQIVKNFPKENQDDV